MKKYNIVITPGLPVDRIVLGDIVFLSLDYANQLIDGWADVMKRDIVIVPGQVVLVCSWQSCGINGGRVKTTPAAGNQL